jgi:trans-aconitate methyltransferase
MMKWNSNLYDKSHSFVFSYGEDLLSLLNPQPDERILDLGCGTGHLTKQISLQGADVIGFDSSPDMIDKARLSHSDIEFHVMDGRSFSFDNKFDAIFSNAVLHWIPEANLVSKNIFDHLNAGGRMVVEFGGKGNNAKMLAAMRKVLINHGYPEHAKIDFWFYPSVGEYATILESIGFRVTYAAHFDRKTPLEGDEGMKNWFRMFGSNFFKDIKQTELEEMLNEIETILKPTHNEDGKWYADYKRIRVVAVKN